MNKILLLSFFIAAINSFESSAQVLIFHDPVTARTFDSEKYSGINGTPFLIDKWINGSVTTSKGTYPNLHLKLDAFSNTVYFNKDDQAYELIDDIITFTLLPDEKDTSKKLVYVKGFSASSLKADQYVQVLSAGKLGLYKSEIKLVSDVNEINRGVIKTFNNSVRYFVNKDNTMQLVKLNKKEIIEIVKDKEDKMEDFIRENKLSFNKEADIKKTV